MTWFLVLWCIAFSFMVRHEYKRIRFAFPSSAFACILLFMFNRTYVDNLILVFPDVRSVPLFEQAPVT